MKYSRTILLLGLLGALAAGSGWLAGSTSGLRLLATCALPFLPATFDPAEIEGTLLERISFGRIEFSAGGVSGSIASLELEWRMAALLRNTLHLPELRIVEPKLTWLGPNAAPVPGRGSFSLPMAVRVDSLAVVDGELRSGAGPVVTGLNLEASGSVSDRELQLRRIALHSSRGQLSGHARASLEQGSPWQVRLAWQLDLDGTAVAGKTRIDGVTERLDVAHTLSAPLAAGIEGVVRGLPDAPAWRLAVRVEPLPPASRLWPDALREFAATLALEGDSTSTAITGQVEFPAHVSGPVPVAGRVGWLDGVVILEDLELGLPANASVTLSGRVVPGSDPAMEFAVQGLGLGWPLEAVERVVEVPALTLRGSGTGDRWQLQANARARRPGLGEVDLTCALQLAGALLAFERCDLVAPDGVVQASAHGSLDLAVASLPYRIHVEAELDAPDYPRIEAALTATGDIAGLEVENFAAELLDGQVDGAGRIGWEGELATDFELNFRDLDPAGVAADWPGRLSGALRLRGLPTGPDGVEITLRSLHGRLRSLPVAGSGTFSAAANAYQVLGARLEIGSAFIAAEGSVDPGAVEIEVAIDVPSLSALHADAAGKLTASARIRGPRDAPTVELEATGEALRWADYGARALRVAALVDVSGRRESQIAASVDGIAGGPGADGDVRLAVDGMPGEHRIRLDYAQASRDQQLVLVAAGGMTGARWAGLVSELSLVQAGRQLWRLQAPAAIEAGTAVVSLREACLDGLFGEFCLDGDWFRGGFWNGWVTLAGLDFAALSEWLSDGLLARGFLTGRVDVAADAGAFHSLSGTLILSDGELRLAPADSSPLLEWDGGVLELVGGPNEARATLNVEMVGSDRVEARLGVGWNAADPPLNGQLDAELGQLNWLTEIVPDLADLDGRANLRAELSGTIGTPALGGRFEWTDGTAQIPTLGLQPGGIGVIAELSDGLLDFTAHGNSGEGAFRSEGQFDVGAAALAGRATLRGQNVLVAALPEARVAADPDLRMEFSERAITIEGEVGIPYARLAAGGRPTPVGVSRDEVLVGPLAGGEKPGLAISSRVRVTAGADVRIEAAGLVGGIEGNVLTAIQPEAPPWGRGELRITGGTFSAFGQRLEIERGRLIYTGGPLDNPGLEIRTVRRVGSVTAGAQVRGTLRTPELSLFSDPPMARAETLSYLTFGKGLRDLQTSDRGAVNQAAGSLAVSGGGPIASEMARRLGLRDADLSVEGGAEGASLVMGRYLGGGLYVGYGLGLFDTVNTLRLRLRINSRVSLEATSGDAVTADLFHTIERD